MERTLVWFTNDVRTTDNESLWLAVARGQVVPVYCIDTHLLASKQFGCSRMGFFRMQFLLESLADLDKRLRRLGSGLLVVSGNPVVEIPRLAIYYQVQQVHARYEVAPEERNMQWEVKKALQDVGIGLAVHHTDHLYQYCHLPFEVEKTPDVFTVFRRQAEAHAIILEPVGCPAAIDSPGLPPLQLPGVEVFGIEPLQADSRAAIRFTGGETAALDRLDYYLFQSKHISHYKQTRNGMVGPDYSSKFSPWLAMGCLSPRTVYRQVKLYEARHGANESTYWLIFELLWREYFRLVMEKYGCLLFLKNGIKSNGWHPAAHHAERFAKWANGHTGNPFIDANMTELNRTGFMSNRGRQNVASYLCHHLNLDWRYGAAWFEQQLIDYDVCSNWGNWTYIAGVGNDPRPNRVFNPQKQADQYDHDHTYRNLWLT